MARFEARLLSAKKVVLKAKAIKLRKFMYKSTKIMNKKEDN